MTQPSFYDEYRRRLLIEDGSVHHGPPGTEAGLQSSAYALPEVQVAVYENTLHDRVDPLSDHPRTAVLRPALELVADEEAMARVVAGIAEDGDHG